MVGAIRSQVLVPTEPCPYGVLLVRSHSSLDLSFFTYPEEIPMCLGPLQQEGRAVFLQGRGTGPGS